MKNSWKFILHNLGNLERFPFCLLALDANTNGGDHSKTLRADDCYSLALYRSVTNSLKVMSRLEVIGFAGMGFEDAVGDGAAKNRTFCVGLGP